MLTVSDTSPLNYLVQIDAAEVLHQLYDRICVPEAVIEELRCAEAPVVVQGWAASPPAWLDVQAITDERDVDARWSSLHRGERAALLLAARLQADLILMDERVGVVAARKSGFRVTGTLGILDEAARQERLDLAAALDRLKTTSFRYPPSLVAGLLAEHAARRRR
jgi:predicted nucleic acid-binding protein